MYKRVESLFIVSASALLLATGLAKTLSLLVGNPRLLETMDPFFSETLRMKHVLLVAAFCEFVVLFVLMSGKISSLWKLAAVAWLGVMFLGYRIGLVVTGVEGPCKCLGTLLEKFPIMSANQLDFVMKFILGYLIAGAYGLLLWSLWWKKEATNTRNGKDVSVCSA